MVYITAHFLIAVVKSLTTITFVCYQAACAKLLVPALNVSELFSKLFQHDYLRPMCKPAVPRLLRVWLICNNIPTVDGDSLVVSEGPNHITYCLNLSHAIGTKVGTMCTGSNIKLDFLFHLVGDHQADMDTTTNTMQHHCRMWW